MKNLLAILVLSITMFSCSKQTESYSTLPTATNTIPATQGHPSRGVIYNQTVTFSADETLSQTDLNIVSTIGHYVREHANAALSITGNGTDGNAAINEAGRVIIVGNGSGSIGKVIVVGNGSGSKMENELQLIKDYLTVHNVQLGKMCIGLNSGGNDNQVTLTVTD